MTRPDLLSFTALLAAGLLAMPAPADVVPVSQERSVEGSAHAEDDDGSQDDGGFDESTDFAPFSAAESGNASTPDAYASGGASQASSIGAGGIDASGSSFANAEAYDFDGFGDAFGESTFDVTFEVDETSSFTIDVLLAMYDNGYVEFSFTGPDGPVVEVFTKFNDEVTAFETGTLAPGTYRVQARTSSSAFGDAFFFDYGFGEFMIDLDVEPVPVTGDLDGDGTVGLSDVIIVLAGWGPCPQPPADCPGDAGGDGQVGLIDLLVVLQNWS